MARLDFLAFLVAAAVIADGNLINDLGAPDRTAENFGMLFPSKRTNTLDIDKVALVEQITRINIGKSCVEQNVEYQSDILEKWIPRVVTEGYFKPSCGRCTNRPQGRLICWLL